MNADPRIKLSEELTPSQAAPALEALDRSRVILRCQSEPQGPANALGAASMLALVSRTHAHVELDRDVALPPNPWSARSLHELHGILSAVRPAPDGFTDRDPAGRCRPAPRRAVLAVRGSGSAVTPGPRSRPAAILSPRSPRLNPTAIEPSAPYGMLLAAGLRRSPPLPRSLAPTRPTRPPRRCGHAVEHSDLPSQRRT